MANYPTSLDTITNPTSGNTLDNPSHSLQHSDANDILEALETKLGIGASPAGSATSGHALVASTGGTTSWTTIGTAGISSGAATNGQVLTADGSGGVSYTSLSSSGLVLLNTTSFSGVASQSVNDVFSATYKNYRIMVNASQISALQINLRLRASGTDATGSNYKGQFNRLDTAGTNNGTVTTTTSLGLTGDTIAQGVAGIDVFNPFVAASTQFLYLASVNNQSRMGSLEHQVSTSYDGFTIFTAGTMTGQVSVYGYNQ